MAEPQTNETFSNVQPLQQETFSNVTPLSVQQPPQQSFLEKAANQPSKFALYNPLFYFDEIGQGAAKAIQSAVHPIDTAKGIYKDVTDTSQDQTPTPVPSPREFLSTLFQGYGQAAAVAPVVKLGGKAYDLAQLARNPELGLARPLGRVPQTGAIAAARSGEALATIPRPSQASVLSTLRSVGVPASQSGEALASAPIPSVNAGAPFPLNPAAVLESLRTTGSLPGAQTGEGLANAPVPSVNAGAPLPANPAEALSQVKSPSTPASQTGEALGTIGAKSGTPPKVYGPRNPSWQLSKDPGIEIRVEGSTAEEIQAQLQKLAARKANVPRGTPSAETPQVQQIPIGKPIQPPFPGPQDYTVTRGTDPFTHPNAPKSWRFDQDYSTNVKQYGYDPDSSTLSVMYKRGGVYHFKATPQMFSEMQKAPSAGGYLHDVIEPAQTRGAGTHVGTVQPKTTPGSQVRQALGGRPSNQ